MKFRPKTASQCGEAQDSAPEDDESVEDLALVTSPFSWMVMVWHICIKRVIFSFPEMAEAVVSALLEQLIAVLYEEAKQEVKLVTGVKDEIRKLQSNFESIRALLDDAEEKQIQDRSIKLWLDRLKDVCYDMEDLLDEWITALLKLKIDEANPRSSVSHSKGKVCLPLISCFSSCRQVAHRRDIALKIKQINEKLDSIAKEKDRYNLSQRDITSHTRAESNPSDKRRVESTSFVEVSQMHGRDEVMKQLVSSLMCGSTEEIQSDVRTISIVEMGGMGKTALAQLVYNDGDVKAQFDKRLWVCVSEDFDMKRVVKAILDSLDPSNQNSDSLSLQNLIERLCKDIEGKWVLLILDDVWTEEGKNWELLKLAFTVAAPGSRILVTTRNEGVAEVMRSVRAFPLKELSDEACWKILRQEAFVGRDEEQCKNLEETGRGIAKKCRGLPLVARTLGGLLCFKKARRGWEDVLNNEIWRWESVQQEVFAPFLLSYYDLPSPIRRCFSYCSVIPRDRQIRREGLIQEWMAQGFISSSKNLEMEEVGVEYFECLVARSFFQDFSKLEDSTVYECKMHDMVVDFARSLMGDEFVFKALDSADDENSPSRSTEEKTRHLSVILKGHSRVPPRMLNVAEKLRSISLSGEHFSELSEDLCNLCIQPKHLRSLDFRGGCIVNKFPEEVGQLMHLRLLRLNDNYTLKELPEAICELCNLQSLDVKHCAALERLPSKMEKLINLTHLDTSLCVSLKSYPKGIGRLTSLMKLHRVVVRCDRNDDEEFSLGDLKYLSNLKSLALMKIVGDEIDVNEAKRANLRGKKHLATLGLIPPSSMDGEHVIKVLNLSSSTDVSISLIGWVELEALKKRDIETLLEIRKTNQRLEQVTLEYRKLVEMFDDVENRNWEEIIKQINLLTAEVRDEQLISENTNLVGMLEALAVMAVEAGKMK